MPQDKTALNGLCTKLKALIKVVKNETVGKYLSSLAPTKDSDYSLWKATKGLKRPKTQIPPIKTNDGKWTRSAKDKADLFAEHLEETFQPLGIGRPVMKILLTCLEHQTTRISGP